MTRRYGSTIGVALQELFQDKGALKEFLSVLANDLMQAEAEEHLQPRRAGCNSSRATPSFRHIPLKEEYL